MPKRAVLLTCFALGTWAGGADPGPPALPVRDSSRLAILKHDYPRAFFFRASEAGIRRRGAEYESWDAEFSRLGGIMGKCLDEEVLGTEARHPEFFTRFKQRHPEQAVLLHFNGNSRDPLYQAEPYFPGHWIYRKATRILSDVPAETGETEIRVEDARDFRVNTGRYQTSADDIALFGLSADGKHDWSRCEQVQLIAVDGKSNTVRVKRGCYGSKPLEFSAGQARAAAHQVEGPWGKNSHLLWYYNFTTHCPKDGQGRTCSDLLVNDLARWFGPGGKLAALDGLEFDVMFHTTHGDTDGDGEIDDGVVDGLNQYGIGMIQFARKLRERMGDQFIIQGDGALGPGGIRSQRAFGWLNGIESEGFPNLNDWDMEDWSGGLNRHSFWAANARQPVFHYINHKWVQPVPGKPGEHKSPEVPFARHRLSFAAAQFTDAMITYSFAPEKGSDGMLGIWDELICGADQKTGWLGKPIGDACHLAVSAEDLLDGDGEKPESLALRIAGDVVARPGGEGLALSARQASCPETVFSIKDLPAKGTDLLVRLTLKAAPRVGYPEEMARLVQVTAHGGALRLLEASPRETGIALRGQPDSAIVAGSGAQVSYRRTVHIGEQSLPSYAVHPPYRTGTGSVYWCRDVTLPAQPDLRFSLGMGEKSPQRSDGVWFQVWLAELDGGKPGAYRQIFEKSTREHAWIPCEVTLEPWAGKTVRLRFVADCGPGSNATTDQGFWGDVRIGSAGEPDTAATLPTTLMTWANDRLFTSYFHFRDIRSKSVSLDFRIEGAEPVSIERISIHPSPDAVYRRFENGLVLANPGLKPYTFDVQAICPGQPFRRLRGTEKQDVETNDGSNIGDTVTLGERDALFLVRTR